MATRIVLVLLATAVGCRNSQSLDTGAAPTQPPRIMALPKSVSYIRSIEEKHSADWKANTIKVGQSLTLQSLTITPTKVELREAVGEIHGKRFQTTEPVLVLTYRVQNISEGQVFRPSAFVFHAIDSYGNRLGRLFGDTENDTLDGNEHFKDLAPGKTATIIIAVKPKIATASWYHWNIYQTVNNQDNGSAIHWGLRHDSGEISIPKGPAKVIPSATTKPEKQIAPDDE